ncbi:3-deoxy-D-manno-octulosonic-acid transferase [Anseongella ginsenosidimutans]|uniref:3-deoxy-D-manno-octulosonic acid transferase n=2 Tax=Anseongella ginsenosidimutans TaxID=496056 RepID=A0A4R3KMD6_9SPHI|nr:3-deoxy-D-manno-octulosonic acid transferase [Anseongella ginsenosidimutans]TCS85156.1 3-deoxy-D-manno-octulosonic-acid transferase [Anseongella ginsenosidimutans]
MVFLYNWGIKLLHGLARLSAFFGNGKTRKWLRGQASVFPALENMPSRPRKAIWFHFASLGEFEQGRPVLERIKENHPGQAVVVSFFSPSGYEIRKNYPLADLVTYLPLDTPGNARRFIELVQPSCAIFTKYEYWFHFYRELKRQEIPLFVISAIFRKEQVFFRWYGGFFRKILACVTRFFVQTDESRQLLASIGFSNSQVSGDTRYDRVYENSLMPQSFPEIARFAAGSHCLVAGSTWPQEEEMLARYLQRGQGWKYIIAPHEVTEEHLRAVLARFGKDAVRYSEWINNSSMPAPAVLVIDRIGMLSSIYRYGEIALVGGGFGKGIHNILEPAVFGMPVLFGPRYKKFSEAHQLIEAGCAFPVTNFEEFARKLQLLQSDEDLRRKAAEAAQNVITQNKGATSLILESIGFSSAAGKKS